MNIYEQTLYLQETRECSGLSEIAVTEPRVAGVKDLRIDDSMQGIVYLTSTAKGLPGLEPFLQEARKGKGERYHAILDITAAGDRLREGAPWGVEGERLWLERNRIPYIEQDMAVKSIGEVYKDIRKAHFILFSGGDTGRLLHYGN